MRAQRALALFAALLLTAGALRAQEKPKKNEPAQREPDLAQVLKWIEQVTDEDEGTRTAARDELLKWKARVVELLQTGLRSDRPFARGGKGGMIVLLDPKGPGETMTGEWATDEEKIRYTLKSLGQGRYQLEATRSRVSDGKTIEVFKDEGSLAELKKKHDFLGSAMALRVPFPAGLPSDPLEGIMERSGKKPRSVESLGVTVRRPSEDLAHHLYLPSGVGFVVESVRKDSPADKLGLKRFDLLVKLDGRYLEDSKQLDTKTGVIEYVRRAREGRLRLE